MAVNINNLNILTFIKDIYLSLKHIDVCFSEFKTVMDTRLIKIEDNQQIILEKLNTLEQICNLNKQVGLDKNIENELLENINNLNKNIVKDKLILNNEELTFANILENNYTITDINEIVNNTTENSAADLEKLLF